MARNEAVYVCGVTWGGDENKDNPYYEGIFKKYHLALHGGDHGTFNPKEGDIILAKKGHNVIGIAKCLSGKFFIKNSRILSDKLLESFGIHTEKEITFILVDKWFDIEPFKYQTQSGLCAVHESDVIKNAYEYVDSLESKKLW